MPFLDLREVHPREPMAGFRGHFVHSATMTFVHWTIAPGAAFPEHAHPHEQVANVLSGQFELTIDGESKTLGPGTVGIIPANALHSGRALTECHIIDVFYPIREDYR